MQLLMKGFEVNSEINEAWIKENCYIAGGACVSHYNRTKINDVDIYFKTKDALQYFMHEFGYNEYYFEKDADDWKALVEYVDKINKKEIEIGTKLKLYDFELTSYLYKDLDDKEYTYIVFSDFSVPLPLYEKQCWMFEHGYEYVLAERNYFQVKNGVYLGNKSVTFEENDLKYQFILRFVGEPQEMMDNTFDFQHCKIAYDLKTNEYIAEQATWEALSRKELVYTNSYYPVSSIKRYYKYKDRGYRISEKVLLDILKSIKNVDFDNKFEVEDQLIGYYEDFNYDAVFR